ncbi:MAG: peptidase M15, partial [Ignavibacteria bacterium]|nr:peptidase M15 [Ignavibacteria bacterium]
MMDANTQLTKNFKYSEFFCKGKQPPTQYEGNIKRVAEELQKLRDYYNKPIIVTSGWRTPEHNKEVGGATNSYHLRG